MKLRRILPLVAVVALWGSGCTVSGTQVVYEEGVAVGFGCAGPSTYRSVDCIIGYRTNILFVIPTSGSEGGAGNGSEISARSGAEFQDAISVIGQWELPLQVGPNTSIGFGKFIATGLAARIISEGVADSLAGLTRQ